MKLKRTEARASRGERPGTAPEGSGLVPGQRQHSEKLLNDKAESPEKAAPSLCGWTHAFAGKLRVSGEVSIVYLDSDASSQPPRGLTTTSELPQSTYGK